MERQPSRGIRRRDPLRATEIASFFQQHGPLVKAVSDAAATDERVEASYNKMVAAYDRLIAKGLDAMIPGGWLEPCDTRALVRALNLASLTYMLDSFGREPTAEPNGRQDPRAHRATGHRHKPRQTAVAPTWTAGLVPECAAIDQSPVSQRLDHPLRSSDGCRQCPGWQARDR